MNRKKIIHVIGNMNIGGAETFLINVLKNINIDKYELIFLCYGNNKSDYEDDIQKLGGRIIKISEPKKVGYIKHMKELKKVFMNENPDVVHAHTYYNSAFSMLVAKKIGIKTRITHSHSTESDVRKNLIHGIYELITRYIINNYSNIFLSCGEEASKNIFYKTKKVEIIYNGVNMKEFMFNEKERVNKRKELGILDDEFVIGHVGRFAEVKNQIFLINIFEEYLKRNPNSRLVFIGDGPLMDDIKKIANVKGIQGKTLFLGKRRDVNKLYNMMDMFVFPSLFEGFPVTLVETQINGLKALVSDKVDSKVKKTEYIQFFNINDDISNIIDLIELNKNDRNKYKITVQEFDIKNTVKNLCKYYNC